jgi:hypothetical protein
MVRSSALLFSVLALIDARAVPAEEPAQPPGLRQSLDDAWWTGPLLAASPATLPQGHVLVEPYLYDAIVDRQFDDSGARREIARQRDYGSLTYLLYGLTDSTTIGLIPRFGYNNPGQGSSVGVGDMTAQVSYRLSRFLDQGWLPAMALVISETFPTGKYDRLSDANDGIGEGSYTTTLALYGQYYLWMPNGRILRTRINLSEAWSRRVGVEDASVFGTLQGFRGRAFPGNSFTFDSAWEYSVTRNWVAALDIAYTNSGFTRIVGEYPSPPSGGMMPAHVDFRTGSSTSISLAPAIEYNWTSTVGIIVGAKVVVAGHNTGAAVIPVAAINLVF